MNDQVGIAVHHLENVLGAPQHASEAPFCQLAGLAMSPQNRLPRCPFFKQDTKQRSCPVSKGHRGSLPTP